MTREEREKHLDWLYRLKSEIFVYMPKNWIIPFADALDVAIKALEQEPKTGIWIESEFDMSVYCSECNSEYEWMYDYCPSCGADMRGGYDN